MGKLNILTCVQIKKAFVNWTGLFEPTLASNYHLSIDTYISCVYYVSILIHVSVL